MAEFLTAIALFAVAHAIPPIPPVRARAISWLGKRIYLGAYAIVSVVLLVWVISAARRAPYWPLWDPAPWQALVPVIMMPFAGWLLIAGAIEPNPLSIAFLPMRDDWYPGPAVSVTRHPIIWAFLLWSGSHIVPNGDVVALILFGGMTLLAIWGLVGIDRRARRRLGEKLWKHYAARTSLVPFTGMIAGRARVRPSAGLAASIILALVLYAWLLLQGHQLLIGVDPVAWLMG